MVHKTSSITFNGGDARYANTGGCGSNSVVVAYTMPASFWQNVWISEKTVVMETRTESNGDVTKRFNLKTGTSGDRVGFAVPGHLGVTL